MALQTVAYGYIELPNTGDDIARITNLWLQEGQYEIGNMGQRVPAELHLKVDYKTLALFRLKHT